MKRKQIKLAAAVVVLCSGFGATMAVRAFFDRPGESALGLMPADTDCVLIEDLIPAPGQLSAFMHIKGALAQNGVKDGPLNFIAAQLNEDELSKAAGSYFGKSIAVSMQVKNFGFGGKPGSTSQPEGIGFISLTDAAAAAAALKGKLKSGGPGYYALGDGKVARVAQGYLEVASNSRFFAKVDAVVNGKAPSLLSRRGFTAVRKLADPGANFKLYMKRPKTDSWGAATGSIEDGGIRVVVRGVKGWGSSMPAQYAPVSTSTLKRLPSGAYVLMTIAQPSAWAGDAMKGLGTHKDAADTAFRGDFVLGLYPSQKPWAGADLLLYMGSNNGAHPRQAVQDLLKEVQKHLMNGKPIFGKAEHIGQASLYGPTPSTKEMLQGIFRGPVPGVRNDVLLKDKTLAYATIGQSVYISTSEKVLKRAIAAASGNGTSIAADTDFKALNQAASSGSEFMLAIDFSRICAGISNTAAPGNADAGKLALQLAMVTHGNQIACVSGGTDKSGMIHGRLFVPIDYSRAAKIYTSKN